MVVIEIKVNICKLDRCWVPQKATEHAKCASNPILVFRILQSLVDTALPVTSENKHAAYLAVGPNSPGVAFALCWPFPLLNLYTDRQMRYTRSIWCAKSTSTANLCHKQIHMDHIKFV